MGCWFCDRLRLKGFAWRGIYITAERAVMWLISGNLAIWTVRVWEEILYWCFWVLWEINSRFCSKTQWQMFLLVFRPPCWCTTRWAPAWRLHTNLYKFGQKVSPHIFHKKNCCDLNFGENVCIVTFFLFSDSGLYLKSCFDFYFDLFWMVWHWKPAIGVCFRFN